LRNEGWQMKQLKDVGAALRARIARHVNDRHGAPAFLRHPMTWRAISAGRAGPPALGVCHAGESARLTSLSTDALASPMVPSAERVACVTMRVNSGSRP